MPRVKIDVRDLDIYNRKISYLASEVTMIATRALYVGAGLAADDLRAATSALQTVSNNAAMGAYQAKRPSYISGPQKEGLLNGLGIASFQFSEEKINTSVGFSGYNNVHTKKWPSGQPNKMIAAICNHGTSGTMIRQPFITVTYEVYKGTWLREMMKAVTEEIDKIIEN